MCSVAQILAWKLIFWKLKKQENLAKKKKNSEIEINQSQPAQDQTPYPSNSP